MAQPGDFSNQALGYRSLKAPLNSLFNLTLANRTHDGKLGLLVAGSFQNTYRGSNRLYYHPLGQPKPEPLPNTFTSDEIQRLEFSAQQNRLGLHAKLDYSPSQRNRIDKANVNLAPNPSMANLPQLNQSYADIAALKPRPDYLSTPKSALAYRR